MPMRWIETEHGFASRNFVARLVPDERDPRNKTTLLDANGKSLGTAFSSANELVDLMGPVVPAAPGFSVAIASINEEGKPIWVDYIPILAWRLESYQNPVPICLEAIDLKKTETPWTIIGPDGRVYRGRRRSSTEWYDQWMARGSQ